METQETSSTPIQDRPVQRKEYQSPKMVEFGNLTELTQFGGDGAADGITASLSTA